MSLSKLKISALLIAFLATNYPNKVCCDSPYVGTTSIFIPYANAGTNQDLSDSPTVNLGFNGTGKHVEFIMDTGSVGIVASPDIFTPARGAKYLGPGQLTYSSSGKIENGSWWTATQQFYDGDGKLVATANVPVLLVSSITCTDDARSCQATTNPTHIAVMGIGFARESSQQPRGTPNYNAFLNLQSVLQNEVLERLPSNWCNGYIVTPTGVHLGLTAANTANAAFVKLQLWPSCSTATLNEWTAAPMTLKANGVSGNGNVLMDTGVDAGFLTPPPGAYLGTLVDCPASTLHECLPDGDVIEVFLPNETNPVAYYKFTVGDNGNKMQPVGVHEVPGADIFFNTSRHFLGGINVIYDNTNGYVGYLWNGDSSGSIGYATPAIVSSETTVESSNNPELTGTTVTFTAKAVAVNSLDVPTGSITFFIDNTQECVILNSDGVATFTTLELSKGSHTIVAKYSGDATFIRSESLPLTQITQ